MTAPASVLAERTVSVAWDQESAFVRLTRDPMLWFPWNPRASASARVKAVGFEHKEGGVFFQEHADGRLSQIGYVHTWEPGKRVRLAFNPPANPKAEEFVELSLVPERTGTQLRLVMSERRNPWVSRVKPPTVAKQRPSYLKLLPALILALLLPR
ncbi:MAG TPA: hypothetical protein VE967_08645 [Gemmatimonadaceae bacterium]|nr:hypothetical protein [Gemmatimonadaceae bacterium]